MTSHLVLHQSSLALFAPALRPANSSIANRSCVVPAFLLPGKPGVSLWNNQPQVGRSNCRSPLNYLPTLNSPSKAILCLQNSPIPQTAQTAQGSVWCFDYRGNYVTTD